MTTTTETTETTRATDRARSATPDGLLLFAHGARDPQWADPFNAVLAHCRRARGEAADGAGGSTVALAFLEFMAPGLVAAGGALAARGCTAVDVVPLFLGAGGHVRKDVPLLMARLQAEHPAIRWTLRRTIGESPAVIRAMAEQALACADSPAVALDPPA